MNYAEQILKDILTEEANLNSVTDAIKKKYEVELTYNADDDTKGSGKRIIQPVTLGHSKSGNLVLRAFQPYGDTKTKIPSWKLFRLDRIEDWKPNKNKHFSEPPVAQFKSEGKYNPNGDKTMTDVLVQASFSGSEDYAKGIGKYSGLKKANDERAARKREQDPLWDLRKNIKKSYDGNKVDYIKKNVEDWQNSEAAKAFRRGNTSSAYEMSQVQNFGDDKSTQTVGPVFKQGTEVRQAPEQNMNYSKPANNGPVYKDQEIPDNQENTVDNNNEIQNEEK